MEGIVNYIALGCSALALILDIVAIALPNWISHSSFYSGLWKICVTNAYAGKEDTCYEFKDLSTNELPGYLQATRALTILGLLLVAAAIAMAVLKIFVMKDKGFLSLGASASAIAGGVLFLIGAIVFAVKTTEAPGIKADVLGAGFRLAIVAGVVAVIAGIMLVIGKNKQNAA